MTESHSKLLADMLESHAVHDFCLVGPKVSIFTPICDVFLLILLCQTSTVTDNSGVDFCKTLPIFSRLTCACTRKLVRTNTLSFNTANTFWLLLIQ